MGYISEPFSISLGERGSMFGTQTFPQALDGGEGAVCGHRVGSQGVSLGHHGRWNKDPQERPLRSELERMQPTLSQLSGKIED